MKAKVAQNHVEKCVWEAHPDFRGALLALGEENLPYRLDNITGIDNFGENGAMALTRFFFFCLATVAFQNFLLTFFDIP